MRNLKILFAFTLSVLLFINCSSDDNDNSVIPPATNPPTKAEFNAIRDQALQNLIQKVTFTGEEGLYEFTSKGGVKFAIPPLYDTEGNPITGNVTLEFIEIYDRGNMVVANKPLMARVDGNLLPLVTGGEFYMNLIAESGQEIPSFYYTMTVPGANTGGVDPNMSFWKGTIDADGNLEWNTPAMGSEAGVFTNAETNEYSVLSDDFGWTNIDILAEEEGEKTPILVQVPEGFNNTNSAVYVSYKGQPGVLAFLDQYEEEKKLFTEHYGWGPIGYELYVIFVSENNGNYLYAIKDITLEKNKIINFTMENLRVASKDELVTTINNLK